MNKQNPIRESLGLTQQEMAILLEITRGHWSMYECGKRELPIAAMAFLSEMSAHMEAAKTKNIPSKASVKNETKAFVGDLLKENQFRLQIATKELAVVERKHTASENAQRLVGFLNSKSKGKEERTANIHQLIASRVTKSGEQNKATELTALQIRVAVLQAEETILKEKIKRIT